MINKNMIIICVLFLTGCATTSILPGGAVVNDPSMTALNVIADKAVQAKEELASMQSAVKISQVTEAGLKSQAKSQTAVPGGWEEKTSLAFTGSYKNLLKILCDKANYTCYGLKAESNPPIVTVEGTDLPLIHYLRAAAAELPDSYDIKMYPNTRSLVVHHG